MHDNISPFTLEGSLAETNIELEKQRIENFLETSIFDQGCVPVLDLDPQWSLRYNHEGGVHDFKVTIYGAEVEDSWQYSGLMNGALIRRHSRNPK